MSERTLSSWTQTGKYDTKKLMLVWSRHRYEILRGSVTRFRTILFGIITFLAVYIPLDFISAKLCNSYCGDMLERDHRQKFRIKDDTIHHALQPNVKAIEEWGGRSYPLFTNSLGFRDSSPREVASSIDAPRLLLMGDSFTEGSGVTWEESFAGLLQDRFKDRNVEVLNSAVSSYAPAVYYALAHKLIVTLEYDVDAVMVFLDQSDVKNSADWYRVSDDMHVYEEGQAAGSRQVFTSKSWIRENSLTVQFTYLLRDYVQYQLKRFTVSDVYSEKQNFVDTNLWADRVANVDEVHWCDTSVDHPEWRKDGMAYAKKYMTGLAELLSDKNIPLTLVIYPWPANILKADTTQACSDFWVDWGAANQVDVITLFDAFSKNTDPWQTISEYFIPYDVHWNPAGHAFVADAVADHAARKLGLNIN